MDLLLREKLVKALHLSSVETVVQISASRRFGVRSRLRETLTKSSLKTQILLPVAKLHPPRRNGSCCRLSQHNEHLGSGRFGKNTLERLRVGQVSRRPLTTKKPFGGGEKLFAIPSLATFEVSIEVARLFRFRHADRGVPLKELAKRGGAGLGGPQNQKVGKRFRDGRHSLSYSASRGNPLRTASRAWTLSIRILH